MYLRVKKSSIWKRERGRMEYYKYMISVQNDEGEKHYILMDGDELVLSSFNLDEILEWIKENEY